MSKETMPVVLTVSTIGTEEHPRYVISDQHLKFWTSETWSSNQGEALKYHDFNDAASQIHALLLTEHEGKPARRFFAPVYLELFTDEKVSLSAIKEWLCHSARLLVGASENGHGPVKNSLGLCHIPWGELREITVEKK
jgi:hypothetical protein